APETASKTSRDNMHDLIAGDPWLLNPEWQILYEERTISRHFQEWGFKDLEDENAKLRYDFFAMSDENRYVIIEIKRTGYPVELKDLQRLEQYKELLARAHAKPIHMVLICGGTLNVSDDTIAAWEKRPDGEIRTWRQIYERTRLYYEHYRAVLR